MTQNIITNLKQRMTTALESLQKDLSGLRTGRASPNLLEAVQVEAYGNKVPINQVGNISVPEPRLLMIQVWDSGLVIAVEKAVRDAGLGLNPSSAGTNIRIALPELTEERRKEISKVAGKYAEQGRIAIRSIRRDGMDEIKAAEKSSAISEDEERRLSDEIQKATDEFIKKVDDMLAQKEKEIMHV